MKIKTSARDFPLSPTPIPVITPIGVARAQRSATNKVKDSVTPGTTDMAADPQRSIINRSKV